MHFVVNLFINYFIVSFKLPISNVHRNGISKNCSGVNGSCDDFTDQKHVILHDIIVKFIHFIPT